MSPKLPSHNLAWLSLSLSSMFRAGNIVLAPAFLALV